MEKPSRSGFVEDERLSAIDRMRRYLRTAGYSKGVLVRLPQRGEPLTNKLVATTTLPPPEAGKRDEMVTIIEVCTDTVIG